MVDFPIPGSPPINTAEPGTNPPPKTLSNSSISVIFRGDQSNGPDKGINSIAPLIFLFFRLLPGREGSTCSSITEFQAPHASHCPLHLA